MKISHQISGKKIRVLIVDDSLIGRKLLGGILAGDSNFEVVAFAENGKLAYEKVLHYKPDVVSMDINMPVMDGIEATRHIMSHYPVPVVIVSSIYRDMEIEMAIQELEAGAVTILPKPYGPGHPDFFKYAQKYKNTLKLMSEIKVVRRNFTHTNSTTQTNALSEEIDNTSPNLSSFDKKAKVLAIGASAGGPEGLRTILSKINPAFPLPILLVQHIDPNFADGFATWLNSFSTINVKIAVQGEKISPGNVYVPPGNKHMKVDNEGNILLTSEKTFSLNRPSIDALFSSIADVYKKNVIAVLLSGMGKDGARELKRLRDAGAYTFAQDEESSLVYGMPGEAVKLGAVCRVLSPEGIVNQLNNLFV